MQHFGDTQSKEGTSDKEVARFAILNVNTFPRLGAPKFLRLKEEVQNIDCVGLSELNKNWLKQTNSKINRIYLLAKAFILAN